MANEYILTQSGMETLKAELKTLRTTGRSAVAEKIKEAKSFNDLSENSEYDEAKSEQGKLEARIAEIEYMLKHAEVLDEASLSTEIVRVGAKVKVKIQSTGATADYQIVGFPQADPEKKMISDESPIGRALVGHKNGEIVDVETPAGISQLEILKISK